MGIGWILTQCSMAHAHGMSARLHALTSAFRSSGVQPLDPPEGTAFPTRALLLMPLYWSSQLCAANGQPFAPPADAPPDWPFTLGQLASCPATLMCHPQITEITGRLPPAWANALAKARLGVSALDAGESWWCDPLCRYAMHGSPLQPTAYFSVMSDGQLMPLPPASAVMAPNWTPACVLSAPKPKGRWSPEQHDDYQAASHSQRHLLRPLEDRLLGPWESVSLYPPAWGHQGVPLHQFSSAHVRMHLSLVSATASVTEHMSDYVPGRAVRPRLWQHPLHAAGSGLKELERSWCERIRLKRTRELDLTSGAPWLLSRHDPQRPPAVRRRHTQSEGQAPLSSQHQPQPAATGPAMHPGPLAPQQPGPSSGFPPPPLPQQPPPAGHQAPPQSDPSAQFWNQLWSAPISNRTKVFGYRLMHAALPCAAMRAARFHQQPQDAYCPHCPAPGGPRPRPLEDYTHLFLECPTYAPALQWLLDIWQHITGHRPPADATVLVAADPSTWPDAPDGVHAQLWLALRLVVLHSIWDARCSRDDTRRTARAVVLAAVRTLREEMLLQFNHSTFEARLQRVLPPAVMQVQRLAEASNSLDVWLASGLCSLSADGQRLNLALDDSRPVPAPALPVET